MYVRRCSSRRCSPCAWNVPDVDEDGVVQSGPSPPLPGVFADLPSGFATKSRRHEESFGLCAFVSSWLIDMSVLIRRVHTVSHPQDGRFANTLRDRLVS